MSSLNITMQCSCGVMASAFNCGACDPSSNLGGIFRKVKLIDKGKGVQIKVASTI